MLAVRIQTMSDNDTQSDSPAEIDQAGQSAQQIKKSPPVISEETRLAINEIHTSFISCGRCSLFLTSSLINIDDGEFEKAVANMEDGWFSLPWDKTMMEVVEQCLGFGVDIEAYHFEGCCPECSRPYRYANPDPDNTPVLMIKGET